MKKTEDRVRFRRARDKARLLDKYIKKGCFKLSLVEFPTTVCENCLENMEDAVLWSIQSLFANEDKGEVDEMDGSDKQDKSGRKRKDCLTYYLYDDVLWSIRRLYEDRDDSGEVDW
jgi:hypothetical protein